MNSSVRRNLGDITEAIESLQAKVAALALTEKVDVGARVAALKNAAEAIDKALKFDFHMHLKDKDGVIPGETFKATRISPDVTRLDQEAFKTKHPRIHAKFLVTNGEPRILYGAR